LLLRVWCFLMVEVLMLFSVTLVLGASIIPIILLVQMLERFLP